MLKPPKIAASLAPPSAGQLVVGLKIIFLFILAKPKSRFFGG